MLAVALQDCVAIGTLKLSGLKQIVDATDAHRGGQADFAVVPTASTSLGHGPAGTWHTYTPGMFVDCQTTIGGKVSQNPASSAALHTDRQSLLLPATSSSKGKGKPAKLPCPPTLRELDRLITQLFLRLEYSLVSQNVGRDAGLTVLYRVYAIPLDLPNLNDRLYQTGYYAKYRSNTVKNHAARIFNKLFHNLHFSANEWRGHGIDASPRWLLYRTENAPSLLEVYNSLDDPAPRHLAHASSSVQAALQDILEEDAPEGMSSRLYGFQKSCLWKLASRELAPQYLPDVTYRKRISVADWDRAYYTDTNMLVWSGAPLHIESKSAIVSEGMGTGKTCICLALILATRHQLAKSEDSLGARKLSDVRTSHRERFPWAQDEHELRRAKRSRLRSIPSLRDIALDALLSSRHREDLLHDTRFAHLGLLTSDDVPYVWEYPPNKGRQDTRSAPAAPQQIFVSAASLVVVPDILVAQWLAELVKHVKPGALIYTKIEKGKDIPTPIELAKYDLVLISESRIRAEEANFYLPIIPPVCRCTYKGSTRDVLCRCIKSASRSDSNLLGVYWKRLIVDEGHKAGGQGELVRICMRLRTESRYVVSGTPSKNLVGIQDVTGNTDATKMNLLAAGDQDSDRNDFERLANIAHFLRIHPFSADGETADSMPFMKSLYEPYQMRGDTSGIATFLDRTAVRHRIPDIILPPLKRSTTYLEFNDLEVLTYNVLLALFASNSVLSERTDEDYFFHPRQKASLNALLSNLSAAHMLFSSIELGQNVTTTIPNIMQAIVKNDAKVDYLQWPATDRKLVQRALGHLQKALDSLLWRQSMNGSMTFSVTGISPRVVCNWDGLKLYHGLFIGGEKLEHLRAHIGKLASVEESLLLDDDDFEEELITAHDIQQHEQLLQELEASKPKIPGEKAVKRKKSLENLGNARSAATTAFNKGSGRSKVSYGYEYLPITSSLQESLITSMASTKVAYVVEQVLLHSEDKFLVFCGGSVSNLQVTNNNLYYISEALGFAGIQHLIFTRLLSQDKLAGYAEAFDRNPAFRVLLLDLKFAGRGLTLTSATRVIFTEPVWHKDEEAQAVKRAHRLGQSRPVHVETLVMRGSFEEKAMLRGTQLNRSEMTNAKTPFEDQHLARMLRDMDFLESGARQSPQTELSAFGHPLKLLCDYKEESFLEEATVQKETVPFVSTGCDFATRLQNHVEEHSKPLSSSRANTPMNISSIPDLIFSPSSVSEARSETPSLTEPAPKRRRVRGPDIAEYAVTTKLQRP